MYDRRVVRGNTYASMIIPVSNLNSSPARPNCQVKASYQITGKTQETVISPEKNIGRVIKQPGKVHLRVKIKIIRVI